ncbi:MAG: hypothetical protein JWO77_1401 [Ilumatobacteraceae bacterium]|nr:hypothetical protein [Ilumatobacteraceae bacterium]
MMQELSAISSAIKAPFGVTDLPDILLVAIDTDCHGGKQTKDDVSGAIGHFPGLVVATPDPEVERWLMLDREAFAAVVGTDPGSVEHTCDEGHFKKQLADALVEAGALSLLGGFEYADEIAETMNLFRSGKIDGCFRIFCSDLRAAIRHLM